MLIGGDLSHDLIREKPVPPDTMMYWPPVYMEMRKVLRVVVLLKTPNAAVDVKYTALIYEYIRTQFMLTISYAIATGAKACSTLHHMCMLFTPWLDGPVDTSMEHHLLSSQRTQSAAHRPCLNSSMKQEAKLSQL